MSALMTSYRLRSSSVRGATRSIKPGIKILPSVVTSLDTASTQHQLTKRRGPPSDLLRWIKSVMGS